MAEEQTETTPAAPAFDWLPEGMEPLADGEYDAIVMGTGLKECVMSGLLSVSGKKVLHVDRNGYYGAECASLNLTNLFEKFQAGEVPSNLGANRDYNVDLIPKFIMACGNLTRCCFTQKLHVTLNSNLSKDHMFTKEGRYLRYQQHQPRHSNPH